MTAAHDSAAQWPVCSEESLTRLCDNYVRRPRRRSQALSQSRSRRSSSRATAMLLLLLRIRRRIRFRFAFWVALKARWDEKCAKRLDEPPQPPQPWPCAEAGV